jgi:hypothetical protein
MDYILQIVRLFFIAEGLIEASAGALYYICKEEATNADPENYWLWFTGGPYIEDTKEAIAHMQFKGIILLITGLPILITGVFAPDTFIDTAKVIGAATLIFLPILLFYIFATDAIKRNKRARQKEETELSKASNA